MQHFFLDEDEPPAARSQPDRLSAVSGPQERDQRRSVAQIEVTVRRCGTTTRNNDNTIWRGSVLTGEEPPLHSGKLNHALIPSKRPNPIPAVPPFIVKTPTSPWSTDYGGNIGAFARQGAPSSCWSRVNVHATHSSSSFWDRVHLL